MTLRIYENEKTAAVYRAHAEIRDTDNNTVAIVNGLHPNVKDFADLFIAAPELVDEAERAAIRLESAIDFIENHCSGENAIAKRNILIDIQESLEKVIAKARGQS